MRFPNSLIHTERKVAEMDAKKYLVGLKNMGMLKTQQGIDMLDGRITSQMVRMAVGLQQMKRDQEKKR